MDSLNLLAAGLLPLHIAIGVIVAWLLLGVLGLVAPHNLDYVGHTLFPISALVSLVLAGAGLAALGAPAHSVVLALGLPDLPFHLRTIPAEWHWTSRSYWRMCFPPKPRASAATNTWTAVF